MPLVPNVTLNNGVAIPQLGLGVLRIADDEASAIVTDAIGAGYRHFDTAESYGNEAGVGRAIAASELAREDLFITSKVGNMHHGFDAALHAFDQSLLRLGLDHVDLYLIHWPLAMSRDFVETWKAFERIYAEGRARAVGVSNFNPAHLQRLFDETDLVPAINQIEVHPYLAQEELLAFNAANGIATEAWAPLARGAVASDPAIAEVAQNYGKSAAQVALRWHVQLGNIVFPKTSNLGRMRENFAIFDFELSDADMKTVSALNRNERTGPNPETHDGLPRP